MNEPTKTDEQIAFAHAHDFYDTNGPGKLSLSETRQRFLTAIQAANQQRNEDTARLRLAWEAGFKLCRSYGDNHIHFAGDQKERQWQKFIEGLAQLDAARGVQPAAKDSPRAVFKANTEKARRILQWLIDHKAVFELGSLPTSEGVTQEEGWIRNYEIDLGIFMAESLPATKEQGAPAAEQEHRHSLNSDNDACYTCGLPVAKWAAPSPAQEEPQQNIADRLDSVEQLDAELSRSLRKMLDDWREKDKRTIAELEARLAAQEEPVEASVEEIANEAAIQIAHAHTDGEGMSHIIRSAIKRALATASSPSEDTKRRLEPWLKHSPSCYKLQFHNTECTCGLDVAMSSPSVTRTP